MQTGASLGPCLTYAKAVGCRSSFPIWNRALGVTHKRVVPGEISIRPRQYHYRGVAPRAQASTSGADEVQQPYRRARLCVSGYIRPPNARIDDCRTTRFRSPWHPSPPSGGPLADRCQSNAFERLPRRQQDAPINCACGMLHSPSRTSTLEMPDSAGNSSRALVSYTSYEAHGGVTSASSLCLERLLDSGADALELGRSRAANHVEEGALDGGHHGPQVPTALDPPMPVFLGSREQRIGA